MNNALYKFAEEMQEAPQPTRMDRSGWAGYYAKNRIPQLTDTDPEQLMQSTYGENKAHKWLRQHPKLTMLAGAGLGRLAAGKISRTPSLQSSFLGKVSPMKMQLGGALTGYAASRLAGSANKDYKVADQVRKETGNMYTGWDF